MADEGSKCCSCDLSISCANSDYDIANVHEKVADGMQPYKFEPEPATAMEVSLQEMKGTRKIRFFRVYFHLTGKSA